jgi:hypothetical protein
VISDPISSWPGLTRPSRFIWKIGDFLDGRRKGGHDGRGLTTALFGIDLRLEADFERRVSLRMVLRQNL